MSYGVFGVGKFERVCLCLEEKRGKQKRERRERGRVREKSGRVVGYGSGRRVSGQEIILGLSWSGFGTSLPCPAPTLFKFLDFNVQLPRPLRLPALNRCLNL